MRRGAAFWPALEVPLLRREVVGLLRTTKAFWVALLTLVASSIIALFNWPSSYTVALYGYENIQLCMAFFQSQLTAAVLLTPVMTAGAIAGERERDTLDSLYMTLQPPASIVGSKVAAALVYFGIVLAVPVPLVLTLHLLGGITLEGVFECYAVTISAVTLASLVGITQSMRCRRTAHAVVRGILWVLIWNVGGCVLGVGVMILARECAQASQQALFEGIYLALCSTSPFVAVGNALMGGPGTQIASLPWDATTEYLVWAGGLAVLHALYLLRASRKPDLERSPRRGRGLSARRLAAGRPSLRSTRFTEAILAGGYEGPPLLGNPIFVKEVRTEFPGRRGFRRGVFWGCLVLYGFLALSFKDMQTHTQMLVVAYAAMTLIFLVVPAVTASAFPREAEQGNLDFLRGTGLSLREILDGKLLAGIYGGCGILTAAAWAILSLVPFESGQSGFDFPIEASACIALGVLALMLVFTAALSCFASVVVKRSAGAILLAYGLLALLYLFWPLVFSEGQAEELRIATNPYAAIGIILQKYSARQHEGDLVIFLGLHALGALFARAIALGEAAALERDV